MPDSNHKTSDTKRTALPLLMLGALGVVFGDIGTSPLYALREAFISHHAPEVAMTNVYGILSMMFWLLMIIVSLKYVAIVLRADNKGEGGNFALLALDLKLTLHNSRLHYFISLIGILGGCLFYADAVITPAISVLSAVEGIEVYYHGLKPFIIPITIAILIFLFCIQRFGTSRVGTLFGPITLVWFVSIGIVGALSILKTPAVLAALSPYYAAAFILNAPLLAFFACGAIVLVTTGAEALYADMGHFGRRPIRLTWVFVCVCLVLNYFGQGALLIRTPEIVHIHEFNPFYALVPEPFLLPMVVLATLATTIASQATISGAFSITRQAIQLGYLPRMRIAHTSHREMGQIYIPDVNWSMLTAVVLVVLLFGSSSALASAYGIAVTGAMFVTTLAVSVVMVKKWRWPIFVVILVSGFFLSIEGTLLAANLLKVASGGWLPLLTAIALFTVLTTWFRGQRLLHLAMDRRSITVREFTDDLVKQNYRRVPGTAIYMTPRKHLVPEPLLLNLRHNRILHERVILLVVQTLNEPSVSDAERMDIQELASGFYRIILRYGFMEEPNIPKTLDAIEIEGSRIINDETSFVLGHESVVPTLGDGMAIWREHLFAWMKRNAGSAADFFNVPSGRVIEIGGRYEI